MTVEQIGQIMIEIVLSLHVATGVIEIVVTFVVKRGVEVVNKRRKKKVSEFITQLKNAEFVEFHKLISD